MADFATSIPEDASPSPSQSQTRNVFEEMDAENDATVVADEDKQKQVKQQQYDQETKESQSVYLI